MALRVGTWRQARRAPTQREKTNGRRGEDDTRSRRSWRPPIILVLAGQEIWIWFHDLRGHFFEETGRGVLLVSYSESMKWMRFIGVYEMNQATSSITDVRRLGYYIPQRDGTVDFAVHGKVASADVLAELHEIISVVFNLQPVIFAFDVVEKNYQELSTSLEAHLLQFNNLATQNVVPISIGMDGLVLVAQKVSNFLSSASAFLAQTERQLRCVHGDDSPELNMWNERRKNLHANSFSYRFLYELRNFAQHRSLPLSNFNISGERSSKDAPMVFKTGALILRDGLLEDGYDWKKLQVEIQKQPSEFKLLPLTTEYLHCLRQLCLEAVKFQDARLVECARYFGAVRRTLKIPVGAVPVIFVGESTSKEIPPSRFEVIPMDQFAYLLQAYLQLIKVCET